MTKLQKSFSSKTDCRSYDEYFRTNLIYGSDHDLHLQTNFLHDLYKFSFSFAQGTLASVS